MHDIDLKTKFFADILRAFTRMVFSNLTWDWDLPYSDKLHVISFDQIWLRHLLLFLTMFF